MDRIDSEGFSTLTVANYSSILKLNPDLRRKLLISLVEYYQLQLEGFGEVKSLPVLMDVFSA
jgi:hypothetical protein